jgi:NAD(P)-dependent dehydrogenase (short-subunit alcohol dehydrogenase family)
LVTADGAGGAIVTWNDARVGISTSDIYAQRLNSFGAVQWALNGVALCTASNDQYTKAVVSDGAGGVIAAWWDLRSGGRDIYARRIDASGTPLWTADGVALCTAADEQSLPAIATDGAGGAIVNLSSAAVRLGSPGQYVQYAASKGAIDAFTLGLAKEVATEGIRVNAVRPGIIDTDIHASGGQPNRAREMAPQVPMQRPGSAAEVAQAIVWLMSAGASYTTGSIVDVTGGR